MNMTTIELVEAFVNGYQEGKASRGRLYIEGDKLINYNTCIAERMGQEMLINITKYSPTTSKHQNRLLAEVELQGIPYTTIEDVPVNTYSLKGY